MSGMVNIMFGIRQDKNFQDFYDVISKEYTDDVNGIISDNVTYHKEMRKQSLADKRRKVRTKKVYK